MNSTIVGKLGMAQPPDLMALAAGHTAA